MILDDVDDLDDLELLLEHRCRRSLDVMLAEHLDDDLDDLDDIMITMILRWS